MQKKKIGQQKKNETEVKGERQRGGKTLGKGQKEEKKSEQFWERNTKPRYESELGA